MDDTIHAPAAALREALTDSDVYSLQFKDPNLTLEQKAGTLGTLFLLDYMTVEDLRNT